MKKKPSSKGMTYPSNYKNKEQNGIRQNISSETVSK